MVVKIPIRPVPKGRPRKGKHGFYTPPETRQYESEVKILASQQIKTPFEGDLSVDIKFYLKGRRGDIDNYVKSLLDGLNGVAWKDDHQIVDLRARIVRSSDQRSEIKIAKGECLNGNDRRV